MFIVNVLCSPAGHVRDSGRWLGGVWGRGRGDDGYVNWLVLFLKRKIILIFPVVLIPSGESPLETYSG